MIIPWFIVWLIEGTPTLIHHGAFLGLSLWGNLLVLAVILA